MEKRRAVIGCAALAAWVLTASPARSHGPHTGAAAGVVGLDVHAQGDVVDVLLAEKGAAGVELQHRRSRDGGRTWSEARRVAGGPAAVAAPRRGNDPQIVSRGERLVAVWTAPGTSRFGGGPLATALSDDGGRTWRAGPAPADDATSASHGFADLAVDGRGDLHLVWLDARDGGQGLRASVSHDFGSTWQRNVSVDTRTCECCQNRLLALGTSSTLAIYRDKNPRDMAVAETADAGKSWTRLGVAGGYGWEFEGCPEVGGALAALRRNGNEELHALAWTGEEAQAGVHHLKSPDGGRHWSEAARLGGPGARHLSLAASGSRLAAVWDEATAEGRGVLTSRSDDGARWSAPERLSDLAGNAAHPLITATAPGRFLVAWTEGGPGGALVWRSRAVEP